MAEGIASLVLSALSIFPLIFDVSHKLEDFFSDYKHLGRDVEKLRFRFSAEERRLNSLHAILFQPEKFPYINASERLAEKLPADVLQEIVEMLYQLERFLSEFSMTKKNFQMLQPSEQATAANRSPMESEAVADPDRLKALNDERIKIGVSQEKTLSRSISWRQKTLWAVYDKRKTESFICEFEQWNLRIRQLLEDTWWPLSIFRTVESLRFLQTSNELKIL